MNKLLAIFSLVLLLGSTAGAQQTNDRPKIPSITVSGDATVSAEPDQAEIDIGVVTQARTAPDATKQNAERVARVLAEIKKQLGKGDEVKTSGYSLAPNYRYPQGGKPEIVGYTASNTLRIKTTNLSLVGRLIDSAMQAGANNVNRLVFTLQDELAAQLGALKMASAKARAKAEAVTAALGLKIVRIISVNEGERMVQPIYRQAMAARAEAASAPTPVEPGTVEVRSTVSMTVEVSDK
ncbi:MAG TPA: SIMPL domain-containing protein [Candidatus Binatia bacterium]|nr:SIMPL domain-containing protein [Candidatus Binatia bacterium]